MKDVVSWSDIQPLVEHDIQSVGVPRGEFVVSQMTKAISNAIKFAFEQGDMPDLPTLDIGTGTGYHTMLYLALGQARVFSIDINPQALVFAKERVSRFFPDVHFSSFEHMDDFVAASTGMTPAVNFYNHSLGDISENKTNRYSMVSFNPPILYPFYEVHFDKPATQGVYFETDDVKDETKDLVYGFYENIAHNNLAKGSHTVCIWASLNRHLVELHPFEGSGEEFVHPCKILEKWFGFQFDNEPESVEDFYRHTTVLGAGFFNQENVGELYSKNIRFGLENHLYSKMLIPSGTGEMAGTKFNFGVLHLVKTSDTDNRFSIVNGSSKARP